MREEEMAAVGLTSGMRKVLAALDGGGGGKKRKQAQKQGTQKQKKLVGSENGSRGAGGAGGAGAGAGNNGLMSRLEGMMVAPKS